MVTGAGSIPHLMSLIAPHVLIAIGSTPQLVMSLVVHLICNISSSKSHVVIQSLVAHLMW